MRNVNRPSRSEVGNTVVTNQTELNIRHRTTLYRVVRASAQLRMTATDVRSSVMQLSTRSAQAEEGLQLGDRVMLVLSSHRCSVNLLDHHLRFLIGFLDVPFL